MVLLPLPLAPTTAQLLPAGTLNDTPCRMAESGRYLQQQQQQQQHVSAASVSSRKAGHKAWNLAGWLSLGGTCSEGAAAAAAAATLDMQRMDKCKV
jgi:hypothetical protein